MIYLNHFIRYRRTEQFINFSIFFFFFLVKYHTDKQILISLNEKIYRTLTA